jgi:hypothetical protein
MRPKESTKTPQNDLFRLKLSNLIDLRHELGRLGERIQFGRVVLKSRVDAECRFA